MENEKPELDAKINVDSPSQIVDYLKQEEINLKALVEKIEASGANVVICQKCIDDMVQNFMARKGIVAIRRAKRSDMESLRALEVNPLILMPSLPLILGDAAL